MNMDSNQMSMSQKCPNFVGEPMGMKLVFELPGIGETLGGHLNANGIYEASQVLGQFLVLRKNEQLFKSWLMQMCGANAGQQRECFDSLRDWCNAFL